MPVHASYVFLLDDAGEIHPLPHELYVALAKGEGVAPDFAGQSLRVADWYVRQADGRTAGVVNETYGHVVFDHDGRLVPAAATAAGHDAWLPTQEERRRMHEIVFGTENP